MRSFNEASRTVPDDENQFIMLGAIHLDADGPEALANWLDFIRPDVITLEFSKYGLHFRRINGDRLRERLRDTIRAMGLEVEGYYHASLEALFSYIGLPYEFTAVSDYARKTGVPFHLVDADLFSHLKLREIDNTIGRENLEALLHAPQDSMSGTSREKVLAELFFKRGIKTYRYTDEMRIRDNFMKDRISLLMRHRGPGCFLHVCGWQHLCDPHDVYTSLKPIKVFVYDRAFCI
jgi:hypothetical protein